MIKIIKKDDIKEKFYHKLFKNKNSELIHSIIETDGCFYLGKNNKNVEFCNNSLVISGGMGSGKSVLLNNMISFFKLKNSDSEIYEIDDYYNSVSDYSYLRKYNHIKNISLNEIKSFIERIYNEYKLRINFKNKEKLKPIIIIFSKYEYSIQSILRDTLDKIQEMFCNSAKEKIYFILECENIRNQNFHKKEFRFFEFIRMNKRLIYSKKENFGFQTIKEKKHYDSVPYIMEDAWEMIFNKYYILKNEKIMLIQDNASLILNLIDN